MILPVLTLLAVAVGAGIRQVRAGMIEILQQDFIRFARLNGIPERRVILRYALRNALAPSVQIIAQNLQYLVGGIIIVESVFTYPGIGTLIITAAYDKDFPMLEAGVLFIGIVYLTATLIADVLYTVLNPRIRLEKAD